MNNNKMYNVIEHIRYQIESELGMRVFIIPNRNGVPDMKNVLCLSDTTLCIWDLIVKEMGYDQIVNEVSKIYKKEVTEIEADVKGFLQSLITNGYIVSVENEKLL